MSGWTDARVSMLRRLWGLGWTAGKIRAAFADEGVTFSRNAICGKVDRLKLPKRPNPIKSSPLYQKPAKPKPPKDPVQQAICRKAAATTAQQRAKQSGLTVVKARPIPTPVAKHASPYRTCQYLHGEAKLRNFCNAPTVHGHSYCEPHYIACHKKPDEHASEHATARAAE